MDQLTEPDWTIDLEDGPAGLQANFGSNCGLRKFCAANSGNSDPLRFWKQAVFQVETTCPSRGSVEMDKASSF